MTFEKYYGFDRGSIHRTFNHEDAKLNLLVLVKALPHAGKRRITPVAPAPFSVGLGNNMMFRRKVFTEIGFFDEKLGAGTPTQAGDETDIFYRILKAGKTIVYEPKAIVFHKHRQTYTDLVNAVYACGLGVAAFLKKHIQLGDLQAAVFYAGRLFNLLFAVSSYKWKGEKGIAYLTFVEFKGWINGVFKH
jgi:GT2 family glycosyltransferase